MNLALIEKLLKQYEEIKKELQKIKDIFNIK